MLGYARYQMTSVTNATCSGSDSEEDPAFAQCVIAILSNLKYEIDIGKLCQQCH